MKWKNIDDDVYVILILRPIGIGGVNDGGVCYVDTKATLAMERR